MKFKDKASGAKNFLKLGAGDSVRGVFRGDIYEFRQHWSQSEKRGTICPGASCERCKEGEKSGFRFRLNLIIKENETYTAKVFEQGWTIYEALKALHEGDYNLENHLMKITRHGTGKDTTYSIVPVPNGSLSPAQEREVAAVGLLPLENKPQVEDIPELTDEDIPF